MDDQVFASRLAARLEPGPTDAPDWVIQGAVAHALAHPHGTRLRLGWRDALRAVVARPRTSVSLRPIVVLVALLAVLSVAGVGYLAWHQNVVLPPVSSPSPTAPVSPSPSPTLPAPPSPAPPQTLSPTDAALQPGTQRCPPNTTPDTPGDPLQARPSRLDAPAAVDSQSGLLVYQSEGAIWTFDLCTNRWRRTSSSTSSSDFSLQPVYDPIADRIVMFGSSGVITYDADLDVASEARQMPEKGLYSAVFDESLGLILVRLQSTGRMWTYDTVRDKFKEIDQVGDVPLLSGYCPAFSRADELMSYDSSVDRVVLYRRNSCDPPVAGTYELSHDAGQWRWQEYSGDVPVLGIAWDWDWLQIAFDPVNELSAVFDGHLLATYDARQHRWTESMQLERQTTARNQKRIPVAYDPVNDRLVVVGGDPLGIDNSAWKDNGDVSAINLATHEVTRLLAGVNVLVEPVISERVDTLGDAPPGQDIVRLRTSVSDGNLTLAVTLAKDWVRDVFPVSVQWNADSRLPPGATGWAHATCEVWLSTYRSFITWNTVTSGRPTHTDRLQFESISLDGRTLTLTAPLAAFGNPLTLGYSVWTGSDVFPDGSDAGSTYGECQWIPLPPY